VKYAALWAAALLLLVAVAAGLLMPYAAGVLYAGHAPHLGALDSLRGSGRVLVDGLWSDPAAGYPRRARRDMPSAGGWWLTAAFLSTLLIAGTVVLVRWLDVRMRSTRLARRWFEITGTRPTSWARPRDLAVLQVDRATPDRLMLGTIGRMRRKLAALPETHVALVAPTGSGKSSRFIIPWVLQADGCPVVVCSTKLDVVDATRAHREKQGRVWVWDPFGPETAGWSPLAGCRSWDGALRRAKWISSALGDGEHAAARFWNGEAAKLLAPLLHAAALVDGSMSDVLGWLDRPETALAASEILDRAEALAADGQLNAVLDLDDRNKGTTFMSAAHLVEAFRYPVVQASDRAEITPADFLDGKANTLYIVAPEDEQEMLAPLVVGMLAEIFAYRQRAVRLTGVDDLKTLYFLLDETANIAPIEQLPKYLSGVRGSKVRIVTVWQDHGQLRTRYREAEATVLSNSQVKVYLGPITDELTRRYVEGALGDERVAMTTETSHERGDSTAHSETFRPRATAQRLQQLEHGRALLIHTSLPAAVIDTTAWFEDPQLRARARGQASADDATSAYAIGPEPDNRPTAHGIVSRNAEGGCSAKDLKRGLGDGR
jgi:type IV secretory pathway TraG/TraD family ATPase VirD4